MRALQTDKTRPFLHSLLQKSHIAVNGSITVRVKV